MEIVRTSTKDVWVLNPDGELFESADEGHSWRAAAQLARPVVQIVGDGRDVLAVSAPRSGNSTRTVLERGNGSAAGWSRVKLPGALGEANPPAQLTVASPRVLLLYTNGFGPAGGRLYASTSDGDSWRHVAEPDWYGNPCSDEPTQIAAVDARDWWILCEAGAAAGSSAKAVLRTVDAGRSWHVTSAVRSLASPLSASAVPRADAVAFSAGSQRRLWLSLDNSLSESADGGSAWQNTQTVNAEGATTTFDVLNARTAFVLAPGGGLWGTTNGSAWHAIGTLNTG